MGLREHNSSFSYVGITATVCTVDDIEASPGFSKKLEAPRIGILTSSLSRDTYLYTPALYPSKHNKPNDSLCCPCGAL
jgi:hypothetical protein